MRKNARYSKSESRAQTAKPRETRAPTRNLRFDLRFEYLAFFLTDFRAKRETVRSLTKRTLEKMKTISMKLGFVETTFIMFDASC